VTQHTRECGEITYLDIDVCLNPNNTHSVVSFLKLGITMLSMPGWRQNGDSGAVKGGILTMRHRWTARQKDSRLSKSSLTSLCFHWTPQATVNLGIPTLEAVVLWGVTCDRTFTPARHLPVHRTESNKSFHQSKLQSPPRKEFQHPLFHRGFELLLPDLETTAGLDRSRYPDTFIPNRQYRFA
jgi:hypothetical protein